MAKPWEGEGFHGRRRNPSSSHRYAAGPSFSHWEKVRRRAPPQTFSSRNSRSHGLMVRMKVSYSACFTRA